MEVTAASTAAATGEANIAGVKIAETFDSFLKLLTTQLQYQDPLDPVDSTEFTNQLVEFTNVEQNIATNRNLEQILSLLETGQTSAAVDHLGKIVEIMGSKTQLRDGQAQWTYELPESAESATLTVLDNLGRPVWTGAGATTIGRHDFVWDGKDDAGNALSEGTYSLLVAARSTNGDAISSTVTASGMVTGVEFEDDEAILLIGDVSVPLSQVRKITLPPADV